MAEKKISKETAKKLQEFSKDMHNIVLETENVIIKNYKEIGKKHGPLLATGYLIIIVKTIIDDNLSKLFKNISEKIDNEDNKTAHFATIIQDCYLNLQKSMKSLDKIEDIIVGCIVYDIQHNIEWNDKDE